jgi:hypothetical protein
MGEREHEAPEAFAMCIGTSRPLPFSLGQHLVDADDVVAPGR